MSAVGTLRDAGYKGEIIMISKEKRNLSLIKIYHTTGPYSAR